MPRMRDVSLVDGLSRTNSGWAGCVMGSSGGSRRRKVGDEMAQLGTKEIDGPNLQCPSQWGQAMAEVIER